jgi:hypothetical protein
MVKEWKLYNNLLQVSVSKNKDEAIKEWVFCIEIKKSEMYLQCICNRKIKNINYFYNKYNGNNIRAGSSCCSVLLSDIKNNGSSNNTLNSLITYLSPSIYMEQNMFDHIKYSQKEIIDFYENKFNSAKKNNYKRKLTDLLKEIMYLKEIVKITYLDDIIINIEIKINEIDLLDKEIEQKRLERCAENIRNKSNSKPYILMREEEEAINIKLGKEALKYRLNNNCITCNKNKCICKKITNLFKKLN